MIFMIKPPFVDIGLVFPDITQDNSRTSRLYIDPETGIGYPSVTTVISKTMTVESKKILDNWKKRVGEKEANRASTFGLNRGKRAHLLIENYYKNEIEPEEQMPHILSSFGAMVSGIQKTVKAFVSFEQNLLSHKLKIAGRTDCIAFLKNRDLAIIDFKSSRRNKTAKDCDDYFIQMAIYGMILNELLETQNKTIQVGQLVIIMGVDDKTEPLIMSDTLCNWEISAKNRINEFYRRIEK